jgi:hypothetical protein
VIRSGVYIGMGGPDMDERARNQLRQVRAEHGDLTLEQFTRMPRDQFFALILDSDGAVAAIPNMLSEAKARRDVPAVIRAVFSAAGEVTGERARRLARIDSLLGGPAPTPA